MYAGEIDIISREDRLENLMNIINKVYLGEHDEKWTDDYCSMLIESLLVRIPIPAFIIRYDAKNRVFIIKGRNRLKAIARYLNDEYPLTNTPYEHGWRNKKYSELSRAYQRQIIENVVLFYCIYPSTPDEVVQDILRRWS
jgi:hypothetical protein